MIRVDLTEYLDMETPELVAYKRLVQEVARKYAVKHRMCGVVDKALAEIGIGVETMVPITVETAMLDLKIELPLRKLKESEDHTELVLAASRDALTKFRRSNVSVKLTEEHITGCRAESPLATIGPEEEQDERWGYVSDEGRVRHFFLAWGPACGIYGVKQNHSARGTGRRCAHCLSTEAFRLAPEEN